MQRLFFFLFSIAEEIQGHRAEKLFRVHAVEPTQLEYISTKT